MIVIVILLLLTVLLFGILFSSFGFQSGVGQRSGERIVENKNFPKKTPAAGDRWPGGPVNNSPGGLGMDGCGQGSGGQNIGLVIARLGRDGRGTVEFDDAAFLKCSEKMIVAVVEAFSERKSDLLRNMLSPGLFRTLGRKMDSLGETLYRTVVVSFDEKTIERRRAGGHMGNGMVVDLRVAMDQINYVEDPNRGVVYGSKNVIEKVFEIWSFVLSMGRNGQGCWLVKSIARCPVA
ncbi:MAG: 39S ribosomal protein L45 [Rickettsiales bacterium]|jgi:predicted lipid-binding transport protein (Tim44 family)|nr:39S ribosomal protein L45 [Rickettsiales bacterium]